ncbi:reticulon-3-like isoform X4 [Agelaius tricolor]|uniref:reticulon-3-like isoform X3 n=1 Tax=Agelaius tricolor TaxID=9191 RepID=UPI0039F1B673
MADPAAQSSLVSSSSSSTSVTSSSASSPRGLVGGSMSCSDPPNSSSSSSSSSSSQPVSLFAASPAAPGGRDRGPAPLGGIPQSPPESPESPFEVVPDRAAFDREFGPALAQIPEGRECHFPPQPRGGTGGGPGRAALGRPPPGSAAALEEVSRCVREMHSFTSELLSWHLVEPHGHGDTGDSGGDSGDSGDGGVRNGINGLGNGGTGGTSMGNGGTGGTGTGSGTIGVTAVGNGGTAMGKGGTGVTSVGNGGTGVTSAGNGVSGIGNGVIGVTTMGNGVTSVTSVGNGVTGVTSIGNGVSGIGNGIVGVTGAGNGVTSVTSIGNDVTAVTTMGKGVTSTGSGITSVTAIGDGVAGAGSGVTAVTSVPSIGNGVAGVTSVPGIGNGVAGVTSVTSIGNGIAGVTSVPSIGNGVAGVGSGLGGGLGSGVTGIGSDVTAPGNGVPSGGIAAVPAVPTDADSSGDSDDTVIEEAPGEAAPAVPRDVPGDVPEGVPKDVPKAIPAVPVPPGSRDWEQEHQTLRALQELGEPPRAPLAGPLPRLAAIQDLLFWRDVKKSAVAFGASLVLLLSLATLSAVTVVAHVALALLSVTISLRVYRAVVQALQKSDEGHPFRAYLDLDVALSPESLQAHAAALAQQLNRALRLLLHLFLVEDLVDSLELALTMWLMTYVGAVFNGITLLILADILAFTFPPLYEKYEVQINHYMALVRHQTKDLMAKIQAKLPGLAKKKPE